MSQKKFDEMAEFIAHAVHCDSGGMDHKCSVIAACLFYDCNAKPEKLPTKSEASVFVEGGDDGVVPQELEDRYPTLHEYLNSFY